MEQFSAAPREEEAADAPEEENQPSGRGRPKAKAKAKARGRPGRPKGKAKAQKPAKATPKAKAKAKAKAHKEGRTGSQVRKTAHKRKAEDQDHEEAPVTPPKRSTRKADAEHGSKTKRAKAAPKSAPRQRKRASRGEAVSFARRNPPEGERGFAEWKAIREAYRVTLAHLKPQAEHEDFTAQGFSGLCFPPTKFQNLATVTFLLNWIVGCQDKFWKFCKVRNKEAVKASTTENLGNLMVELADGYAHTL